MTIYVKSIIIVYFLLDKGHEAKNLQKECLFLFNILP